MPAPLTVTNDATFFAQPLSRAAGWVSGILLLTLTTSVSADVAGTVLDDASGLPLPSVKVSVQASEFTTLTNSAGEFTLQTDGGVGLIVVAATEGYFHNWIATDDATTDLVIRLSEVPLSENANYEFSTPNLCGTCHNAQVFQWSQSRMANAGYNTWVNDLYAGNGSPEGSSGYVYLNDSVHAEENPSSQCAACHQPERWIKEPGLEIASPGQEDARVDHGISCQVCHQMAKVDERKPNFPGVTREAVTMTLPDDSSWTVQYGALADVSFSLSGSMQPSYQPQLRARVCGTCHQNKNDHDSDGDFEDEGGIVSEPTFVEWQQSSYANEGENYTDCVDCHMPATGAAAACTLDTGVQRADGEIRSHDIRGTTADFLENAVTLTLETENSENEVLATVTILNDQTGHHVPTGVAIRNMVLLVEATHQDGSPLEHVGGERIHTLGGEGPPEDGNYAGLPGKLYGRVTVDAEGNSPAFFTDAVAIAFDNRIAAQASDETLYSFESEKGGDVSVRARLIYRRAWRALVAAKGWTTDGQGATLADITPPHFGSLMEEAIESITLPEKNSEDQEEEPEPPLTPDVPLSMGGQGGEGSSDNSNDSMLTGGSPMMNPAQKREEEEDNENKKKTKPPQSVIENNGDSEGCGCVAVGNTPQSSSIWLLVSLAVLGLRRRRYAELRA